MIHAARLFCLILTLCLASSPAAYADVCEGGLEGVTGDMNRDAVIAVWNRSGLQEIDEPYVPRSIARRYSVLLRSGKTEEAGALLPASVRFRPKTDDNPRTAGLKDLLWLQSAADGWTQTTIKASYRNDYPGVPGSGMQNEQWALWPMIEDRLRYCDDVSEVCRQKPGEVLIVLKQSARTTEADPARGTRASTVYGCRYQLYVDYTSVTEEIVMLNNKTGE